MTCPEERTRELFFSGRIPTMRDISVAIEAAEMEMRDYFLIRQSAIVRENVEAERERCAKVAETCFDQQGRSDTGFVSSVVETIAEKIRKGT